MTQHRTTAPPASAGGHALARRARAELVVQARPGPLAERVPEEWTGVSTVARAAVMGAALTSTLAAGNTPDGVARAASARLWQSLDQLLTTLSRALMMGCPIDLRVLPHHFQEHARSQGSPARH